MPQIVFVIEIDWRDDGNLRRDDIRRIETATHADLINCEIHAARSKRKKGHRRDAFEERWMRREPARGHERFDRGVYTAPSVREILVRNVLTIDADALVDALEVRRSIEPGSQAGHTQDRLEHRSRRAFAVCPSDVYTGHSTLRLAQMFGKDSDVLEAEFLHRGCYCGSGAERGSRDSRRLARGSQLSSKCQQ